MVNVSKFVKEHIPLCVCSLGIAILGYLGYHAVRWIINKCSKTEKTDALSRIIINSSPTTPTSQVNSSKNYWCTRITKTKEFDEFKKNWKNLANSEEAREQEARKLKSSYKSLRHDEPTYQSPYNAPLGNVYGIPGNFSMWMSGVALVAAYLAEKKKIQGLYVCESLESLSAQIKQINSKPENQRYAFVVGTFQSGFKNQFPIGFEPNFPQHKVTVCVEKKDGQLTIALLDAAPKPGLNKDILPQNLTNKLWSGYDQWDKFNCQELAFRAILNACRDSKYQARLLHSQALRQKSYGCEVFALQDALAYLRDPDFFSKIECSKEKTIKIDHQYEIEAITTLPPEYMIGTQSSEIIKKYREGRSQFDKVLPGKKKTLQNYLDANFVEVTDENGKKKTQNHYITKKSFKYLNFALLALKHLNKTEINQIVDKVLIK